MATAIETVTPPVGGMSVFLFIVLIVGAVIGAVMWIRSRRGRSFRRTVTDHPLARQVARLFGAGLSGGQLVESGIERAASANYPNIALGYANGIAPSPVSLQMTVPEESIQWCDENKALATEIVWRKYVAVCTEAANDARRRPQAKKVAASQIHRVPVHFIVGEDFHLALRDVDPVARTSPLPPSNPIHPVVAPAKSPDAFRDRSATGSDSASAGAQGAAADAARREPAVVPPTRSAASIADLVLHDGGKDVTVPLIIGQQITCGRSGENDLVVQNGDLSVSGRHLTVAVRGDGSIRLHAHGRTGTFVTIDGQQRTLFPGQECEIVVPCEIVLGDARTTKADVV